MYKIRNRSYSKTQLPSNKTLQLASDSKGNIYVSDFYGGRILKVDTAGTITVVAGGGNAQPSENAQATEVSFRLVAGVAVDSRGQIFLSAQGEYKVFRVDTSGHIHTYAGSGSLEYSGDGGPATSAGFSWPEALALDAEGDLFVVDQYVDVIRKINTAGVITTIAGKPNQTTYTGDNGPALQASFGHIEGLFVDVYGNLLIADPYSNAVRMVVGAGSAANPEISSVSPVANQSGPTILISGSHFDSLPASELSTSIDTPFLKISGPLLCGITGCTGSWNAGYLGNPPNSCKVTIGEWTDSRIVVSADGIGGLSECLLFTGHDLTIEVRNPANPNGAPATARAQVVDRRNPPIVTLNDADYGPQSGGNEVTISGSGFTGANAVWFGRYLADSFIVESDLSIVAIAPAALEAMGVQVRVAAPGGTWNPPLGCVLQLGCPGAYFFIGGITGTRSANPSIDISCSKGTDGFSCTANGLKFMDPSPGTSASPACLGYLTDPDFDLTLAASLSANIQTDGDFGFSTNSGLPSAIVQKGTVTFQDLSLTLSLNGSINQEYQLPIPIPQLGLFPCVDDLYLVFNGGLSGSVSGTLTLNNLALAADASWVDGKEAFAAPHFTCSGQPLSKSNAASCIHLTKSVESDASAIEELRFQIGADDLHLEAGLTLGEKTSIDSKLNPQSSYADVCWAPTWEATANIPDLQLNLGGNLAGPFNLYASEPDASLECPLGAVSATTTTVLKSSTNPAIAGNKVTFTAAVSPIPDGGTVTISDGISATARCAGLSLKSGQAACVVAYTNPGSYSVIAAYSGDEAYIPSKSLALTQLVAASAER